MPEPEFRLSRLSACSGVWGGWPGEDGASAYGPEISGRGLFLFRARRGRVRRRLSVPVGAFVRGVGVSAPLRSSKSILSISKLV